MGTQTIILEEELKEHSFTDQIMEAQFPPNWKGLNIDKYENNKYNC